MTFLQIHDNCWLYDSCKLDDSLWTAWLRVADSLTRDWRPYSTTLWEPKIILCIYKWVPSYSIPCLLKLDNNTNSAFVFFLENFFANFVSDKFYTLLLGTFFKCCKLSFQASWEVLTQVWCKLGGWSLVININCCSDFYHNAWKDFGVEVSGEILKLEVWSVVRVMFCWGYEV